VEAALAGAYRRRTYNSLLGHWVEDDDLLSAEELTRGVTLQLEHKGFCLLELRQEV